MAASARAALEVARSESFDLLLTDISMVPLFEVSKTLLSELNLRTLLDTVTGVAL